jgi:hypothetical protein
MTFEIVGRDNRDSMPKPHPRYAQIALAFRAAGVNVKDDDFEQIDSLIELEQNRTRRESKSVDSIDLLVANALLESNCVSQDDRRDADSADRLIAGYLPQTKQFLVN